MSQDVFSAVKMANNGLAAGVPPRACWGSLQRSPRPPNWKKKGDGHKGKDRRKGREGGRVGRGRLIEEVGKGRGGRYQKGMMSPRFSS